MWIGIGVGTLLAGAVIWIGGTAYLAKQANADYVWKFVTNNPDKAAVTLRRDGQTIAQSNSDRVMPLASAVKTMIAIEYAKQAADAYEWTNEEVREFASTMKDKANDLSLTYRLKNGALPMERELCDVSELARRSVLSFVDDPRFAGTPVTFSGPDEPVLYPVDPKWFRRSVDNVLANALLHNPPDTEVKLSVYPLEPAGFTLDIEDRLLSALRLFPAPFGDLFGDDEGELLVAEYGQDTEYRLVRYFPRFVLGYGQVDGLLQGGIFGLVRVSLLVQS